MKCLIVVVAILALASSQKAFRPFQGGHKAVFVYKPDNSGVYRGASDGRYTADNSGAYNNNDGKYHPDNSGSYVHSDDKYKHQGEQYKHQADKFGNGGNYNGGNGGFGNGGQYNGNNGNNNNAGVGSGASTILSAGDVYGKPKPAQPGKRPVQHRPGQFSAGNGNQGNGNGNQGLTGVSSSFAGNAGNKYENNNYRILRQEGKVEQDGYHYLYETENGIEAEEQGKLTNVGTDEEGMRANGFYTYTGPDNIVYTVRYTADENGFVPEGAHIPTPPPIPAAILRALEYQRSVGTL